MSSQNSEGVDPFPQPGIFPGTEEATSVEGELPLEEPVFPADDALQDPLNPSKYRIVNVLRAARADVAGSDHKARTISNGIAVAGVQAIGWTRAPSVLIPQAAIEVLKHTGSPAEAGLATAALFGAWSFTVGETINNGMVRYPTAVKATGDNFPSFIKHFSNSLPGLEASGKGERGDDPRRLSLARSIGSNALTHVRRGLTAVGIGIVPYIGTAGIQGESKPAIRKLSLALSVDGGAVVGLMFGGLTETIVKISHDHPELAHHIQDDAGSTKLWYGVAGTLMAGEWLNNKRKDRKASRQAEESDS